MCLMSWSQSPPDDGPDLVFLSGVRSIGNGIAGMIFRGDLRDLITAATVFEVAKSRMIGIELHDGISIGNGFLEIACDDAGVDVIGKYLSLFSLSICAHNLSPCSGERAIPLVVRAAPAAIFFAQN